MWFEKLTGFQEKSPENVRQNLTIEDDYFISSANFQKLKFGSLDIPTLGDLRLNNPELNNFNSKIKVSEIVADVQKLHIDEANANALFQVASQFNLLEMINPRVTPESGIDQYEFDRTQGPICAMSCGAGTIYRNYFVEVNGKIGQTENNQIDCLDLIGKALENEHLKLWEMKNGYALASQNELSIINEKLAKLNDIDRENLKAKLKVGIQWNTEVTVSETKHLVSQIFCSALPVAYSPVASHHWEAFARIILEALYEATLYAALINLKNNHSNLVYLTLVGGGAFGNEEVWILESMQKAIHKFKNTALDVKIVSYGQSNPRLKAYF
ncbi:hypothetical protein [Soonwooa sp.]|uniref:hypothetical protein n=1 Tax=Soonwooa sp. TaxID=1938592 RepID=UPI002612B60D|nr:hypothetical protein [Soonwooa sp.]